jgi:hypothetical protein
MAGTAFMMAYTSLAYGKSGSSSSSKELHTVRNGWHCGHDGIHVVGLWQDGRQQQQRFVKYTPCAIASLL